MKARDRLNARLVDTNILLRSVNRINTHFASKIRTLFRVHPCKRMRVFLLPKKGAENAMAMEEALVTVWRGTLAGRRGGSGVARQKFRGAGDAAKGCAEVILV